MSRGLLYNSIKTSRLHDNFQPAGLGFNSGLGLSPSFISSYPVLLYSLTQSMMANAVRIMSAVQILEEAVRLPIPPRNSNIYRFKPTAGIEATNVTINSFFSCSFVAFGFFPGGVLSVY